MTQQQNRDKAGRYAPDDSGKNPPESNTIPPMPIMESAKTSKLDYVAYADAYHVLTALKNLDDDELTEDLVVMKDLDSAWQDLDSRGWTVESSSKPSEWSKTNRSVGQDDVTALLVQANYGGQIMLGTALQPGESTGYPHYFNVLPDGRTVDFTRDQYADRTSMVDPIPVEPEGIMSAPGVQERYRVLCGNAEALPDRFGGGGGYAGLLEENGWTVLAGETFGSYQGDYLLALKREGEDGETVYGFTVVGYGSCSGCDAYEAAYDRDNSLYDDDEDDEDKVRDEGSALAELGRDLARSVTSGSLDEIVSFIQSNSRDQMDWYRHEGDYTWVSARLVSALRGIAGK